MNYNKLTKSEIKDGLKQFETLLKKSNCYLVITNSGIGALAQDKTQLMSMIAITLRELKKQSQLNEKDIKEIFRIAKATDEEIETEALEKVKEILEELKNIGENNE